MSQQSESDNRQDIEAARAANAKINWAEVLTESGQKQKRNLLAWAAIAIVLGVYGVPLTHVPWLCIDIPQDRQSAAVAIVAAPLVYTFAGFVLYVLYDLKRWRLQADSSFLHIESNTLFRLNDNIWKVLTQLDDSIRSKHVTVEQSETVVRSALQEAQDAMVTLQSIRAAAVRLERLHVCIAYGWELIVPIIIGGVAIWLSLPPFIRTIEHVSWSAIFKLT